MTSESTPDTQTFSELGLSPAILEGVLLAGFNQPSPVQSQAIPLILKGHDLIARARTGTGKTAAFGLPMMSQMPIGKGVQMLVMTPTRELALQVSNELEKLGSVARIQCAPIYGGKRGLKELELARRGADIVVATPGRLLDYLRTKQLGSFAPQRVVIDEADEMLDMGFIDDIRSIFEFLPKQRQTVVFSATLPPDIQRLTREILTSPEKVDVTSEEMSSVAVDQFYSIVDSRDRELAIERMIAAELPERAIIFCQTKRETDQLWKRLSTRGIKIRALHGDMEQNQRQESIRHFRSGHSQVLVATDVAARGLDIQGVSHVFNLTLPRTTESYVHRIGRTARAGASGKAISFITPNEFVQLKRIEAQLKTKISALEIPKASKVDELLAAHFAAEVLQSPVTARSEALLERMKECATLEQIALALISKFAPDPTPVEVHRLGLSLEEHLAIEEAHKQMGNRRGGGGSYGRAGYQGRKSGGAPRDARRGGSPRPSTRAWSRSSSSSSSSPSRGKSSQERKSRY